MGIDEYGQQWADDYDDVHQDLVVTDEQLDLLASLAGAGPALELGIGTGRVALPLAARGVAVAGVDASTAMVDRLRDKPGGDGIPVSIGNMVDALVEGPFRLVYVVFNTLFVLADQAEQVRCFRRAAELLEPGGAFVIECFVPDVGRFDRGELLRIARMGPDWVQLSAARHDPVAQVISAHQLRIGDDAVGVRPVRLRYAWPAELDLMAQLAGFVRRQRWGGWHREPFTDASTNHVSVYTRGGSPGSPREVP